MSEVKFACPVCGQHITADSESSGRQLECPTCFRKLIVPQPPALPDSKLILSASQVAKPRPTQVAAEPAFTPARTSLAQRIIPLVGLVLILAGGATAAWVFWPRPPAAVPPKAPPPKHPANAPTAFPVPKNLTWSLDTTDLVIPAAPAVGALLGNGFKVEKASIQGGVLSLRQGKRWRPEMNLTVALAAREPEELSGRSLEFPTNHAPPLPRIAIHHKDDGAPPGKQEFPKGYALKVAFDQPVKGKLPGRIYLCLPDSAQSVVAGTFEAEIKHPPPRKPQAPQPP